MGQWVKVWIRRHWNIVFRYLYIVFRYLYIVFWYLYIVFWYLYIVFWYLYIVFWYLYVVFWYLYIVFWYLYIVFWYLYISTYTHTDISVSQGLNADINSEELSKCFSTVKNEIFLSNFKKFCSYNIEEAVSQLLILSRKFL